jgi:RecJ-like exonuclease
MSDGGKGDKRRPYNQANWDRNYILAFGIDCKNCSGTGKVTQIHLHPDKAGLNTTWKSRSTENCPFCNGLGRVDKHGKQVSS